MFLFDVCVYFEVNIFLKHCLHKNTQKLNSGLLSIESLVSCLSLHASSSTRENFASQQSLMLFGFIGRCERISIRLLLSLGMSLFSLHNLVVLDLILINIFALMSNGERLVHDFFLWFLSFLLEMIAMQYYIHRFLASYGEEHDCK